MKQASCVHKVRVSHVSTTQNAKKRAKTTCVRSHEPNEETEKALRESRRGEGETFDSLDEFWEAYMTSSVSPLVKNCSA